MDGEKKLDAVAIMTMAITAMLRLATCRDAGVSVVADAVINHMTGQDEPGTGRHLSSTCLRPGSP